MKLNLLFTGIVAMVFASCSTTIERNATAFGGGWGMNSSKKSYKSKPSEEKKETPRNSAQTGKKSTQLIISNSQRNEVIPEKQLKAEDLFTTKEFKNLNTKNKFFFHSFDNGTSLKRNRGFRILEQNKFLTNWILYLDDDIFFKKDF